MPPVVAEIPCFFKRFHNEYAVSIVGQIQAFRQIAKAFSVLIVWGEVFHKCGMVPQKHGMDVPRVMDR
jgi:hypothetical protein